MHIDWWTVIFQAINFLILVWLLQRFLFKPVMRVIESRRQEVETAFQSAETAKREAEATEKDLQSRIEALAAERRKMVQEARNQIEKERTGAVDRAKKEAEEIVELARRKIEAERSDATENIKVQAAALAAEMAAATLEGSRSAAVTAEFADTVLNQLEIMSAEEKASLGVGGAGGWGVCVTAAHALDKETQARLETRLRNALGEAIAATFEIDNELIAGAEVAFPAAVMRLSWRDFLNGAQGLVMAADARKADGPSEESAGE